MKKFRPCFIIFLLFPFFFKALPAASAQTIYIDPVIGDNRNPGTSPTAPLKSPRSSQASGNDRLIFLRSATLQKARMAPACAESQLERIILGPKTVTGWEAFSTTIWNAPLVLQPKWHVVGIAINGNSFLEGCAIDFLDSGQYYLQNKTLYINDTAGNPDSEGNPVVVTVHNEQSGENSNLNVTGWASSSPAVWQVSFPGKPIHVSVDETLFDQYWWYGKSTCGGAEAGQDHFLYLRDSGGNPDFKGKVTTAIVETGGWATSSGDFNGDGLQDVVHSNGGQMQQVADRVYINYGAPEFSPSPKQILTSPNGEEGFGYFVASAGDVNNDGFDDLLVAMDWGVGKVFLFMGSQSGLDNTPSQVLAPPKQYPAYGFGHGIAGNGDINGDGHSDILIMGGNASSAYLCVYLGSGDLVNAAVLKETIEFNDKEYNGSVCIIGDMNNDGYDEVALSLPAIVSDQTPADNVEVMIFQGSQDGKLTKASTLNFAISEQLSIAFGTVAAAGDVNSDGLADLIIGNQWAEGSGGANQGEVYLFLGSKKGPGENPDVTIPNPDPEADAYFGSIVAGIGDFDRDGNDDIAVGCPYSHSGTGFIATYSGSDDGLSDAPTQRIEGVGNFGWSLSPVGDLKGNSQPYLIAGEEFGAAYLYALPCDTVYYKDDDNDGYGDGGLTTMACVQPPGYVSQDSDCSDDDDKIRPDAEEICNGIDDNCDGKVDEGCPPPVADSGADQQVVEGGLVKLDGSASSPAEASRPITTYTWTQIDGPGVTLSDASTAGPSFMTPPVGTDGAVLVFQLTVQDAIGLSDTGEVTVAVQDNGITGFPDDVLTFMSATGMPIGIKVQGEASLLNIVPVDPAGLPESDDTPSAMIYGLFDISLRAPTSGAQADVTFYFPSPADSSHVWCRYNPVDGWADYSTQATFEADRKSITIHLTDGKAGDDDQSANNVINNVSGLGVSALEPSGGDTDPDGDGGGSSSCFISAMNGAAIY